MRHESFRGADSPVCASLVWISQHIGTVASSQKTLGDNGANLPVGSALVLALAGVAALALAWGFAAHRLKFVEVCGAAVCIALAFALTRVRLESTITASTL